MPSLLITRGQRYDDKDNMNNRKAGQELAGEKMLEFFRAQYSAVEVVRQTLDYCMNHGCIVWIVFDRNGTDEYAKLVGPGQVRGDNLFYEYVKVESDRGTGEAIASEQKSSSGRLRLIVEDDDGKRRKAEKVMRVLIPYDRYDSPQDNPPRFSFDDTYLTQISGDIRDFPTASDANEYLLSSLTFRRCL